jgi:hypothetical protein
MRIFRDIAAHHCVRRLKINLFAPCRLATVNYQTDLLNKLI